MRYRIVKVMGLLAALIAISVVVMAQTQSAPSMQTPPSTQSAPQMQTAPSMQGTSTRVTIAAGTRILVRMIDSVDASKQPEGTRFTASLETNLQADDVVVAPRGTTVYGQLINAEKAGRMSGGGTLTLELTDISINGTAYPLVTSDYEVRTEGKGSKTARRTVGGAGLGALIGGIAGGGTGAAIGAVSGGALGAGATAATSGQQASVPSESLLEFRLEQPTTLPVAQ
jgi:hypothetical protein